MHAWRAILFFSATALAGCGSGASGGGAGSGGGPSGGATPPRLPLRQLASQCGISIGPAVAYGPLVGEPAYSDTLAREFDILTPENEMKWASIHPQRSQYTFDSADAMMAFALGSE